MKEILNRFFLFVKNPEETSESYQTLSYKLLTIFTLFFVCIPCAFMFLVSFIFIFNEPFDELGKNKMDDLLANNSKLFVFFLAVIFVPLIEEIIFRLPLKFNRNYILLSLISIANKLKMRALIIFLKRNRSNFFKFFYYSMALCFGLVHVTNFENWKDYFYLAPVITIAQTIAGLILGYIRIKFGFFWGVLHHGLNNFIILSPFFLGNFK